MSLVVNHNLMAMNASRNLSDIYGRLSRSTQRLSSGLRVNSAMDDAAGLAIRELMRADIQVFNQGIRNASDGISMIQTAEGAMNVIDEKLVRMKELAEQAATGTYTTAQREIMDSEYQAMAAEIDRIANATEFNGVKLLDGSLEQFHDGSGMKIHFGTGNSAAEDYYFITMGDVRATEATGLRVGNSDPREVWRTTSLNAASATTYLANGPDTPSTTVGVFGIQYSNGYMSSTSTSLSWNMYGYVAIDPERDTLYDIETRINQGSQARGTITFSTGNMVGEEVTVNGQVFTFSTANNNLNYNGPGAVSTIGISSWTSATTVAAQFAGMFNSNYADTGVMAAVDGNSVHIIAAEFGEAGNEIGISSATSGLSFSAQTLSGGGVKVLTADAWWDESDENYELELSMDLGGDTQQIRLFSLTTGVNGGDFIKSTETVGYWNNLFTQMTSGTTFTMMDNYLYTDEDSEWNEARNGAGNTAWDGANIRTQSAAQLALAQLDAAIEIKDIQRAELGAFANRLENTITNLQIQAENLQAAESRISDVDVAQEMTEFTKNNILAQTATAMLAQANSLPQLALQLLG